MSPALLRRSLLASLVIAAGSQLPGCMGEPIHGYLWAFDPSQPVCKTLLWKQIRPDQAPGFCSNNGYAAPQFTSCAINCMVLSPYSEAEARSIDVWGETLYAHESRHVLQRMVHP